MSHYAVFVSFSFVLDTMQARCMEVPWSVIQFRCTQLPKLTVTVTSHHITSHHITSLLTSLLFIIFYILSSLCILLLHMSYIPSMDTADLMQNLMVVSTLLLLCPNNLLSLASAYMCMIHNYSEQPVSKSMQITSKA